MDEEEKLRKEEELADGVTSAPGGEEGQEAPQLEADPQPTPEEVEDAGFGEKPEEAVPEDMPSEPAAEEVGQKVDGPMIADEATIEAPARTFTQSDVDEIAGKTRADTRERTFRYIYDRYGVSGEEELDGLVGDAQRYASLRESYDSERKAWEDSRAERDRELNEVKEQVALLQSGILRERFEDAKAILKGKGLEVTAESIESELPTHPEWMPKAEDPEKPYAPKREPSVLSREVEDLGNEPDGTKAIEDEGDVMMRRYFKV